MNGRAASGEVFLTSAFFALVFLAPHYISVFTSRNGKMQKGGGGGEEDYWHGRRGTRAYVLVGAS